MNNRRWEKLFVILAMFFFTGPVIPVQLRHGGFSFDASLMDATNNSVLHIVFIIICAVTFTTLGFRRCMALSTKDKLLCLLLVLVVLSIFWSDDPSTTIRRAIGLLGTVLMGVYLVANYEVDELTELLAWSLGIAAALSLATAIAFPDYGIMSDSRGDAWRGIYQHKNMLGRKMALGSLSFVLIALGRHRRRAIGVAGFLLSFLVLLRSGSIASLLVLLMLLLLMAAFRVMRTHRTLVPALVISLFVFAAGYIALSDGFSSFVRMLGRDSTLTGRIEVWQSAVLVIERAPWLGHGYGTGWAGEGNAGTDLARFSTWNAPHAHNGLLTIFMDLGFVGLALFVLGYGLAIRRALAFGCDGRTIESFWPLIILSFLLLSNITESVLLKYDTIDCVLYIAALLWLAKRPGTLAVGHSILAA